MAGLFRRALLGYRRAEVEEAITARQAALAAWASEATSQRLRADDLERLTMRFAERVVERERELRTLRDELARERERGAETVRALASMADELEAMRRAARGQATRIRMAALREAAEVHDRASAIADGEGDRRLVAALAEAVERLASQDEMSEAEAGKPPARRADLFDGLVEVEIGPLADFSQLVGFEDAARSIAATSELSIKRFSAGRATLAVGLSEPVELLRELEERSDIEFRVRDRRSDRLVLDVGDDDEGKPAG